VGRRVLPGLAHPDSLRSFGAIMSEIEYEVREQDLIAFNEHQLAKSESLQKTLRKHQATIPGLIVVISLFLFFY
jgi:hypothetical protein